MAGIPLNTFRTVTKVVPFSATQATPGLPYTTQNPFAVYQAPPGTTGVVLYCQVANISDLNTYTISMWHFRPSTTTFTEVVKKIGVPPNDTLNVLGGKLVLETSDILFVSGSAIYTVGPPEYSDLKLIASVLESANQ